MPHTKVGKTKSSNIIHSQIIKLIILRPYGRAADPVAILDTITELKSMAPGQDVRSEEKRSEEKKRKEKTRYWLHAHGAGNEREKEKYFHKGSTPTPKRRSF